MTRKSGAEGYLQLDAKGPASLNRSRNNGSDTNKILIGPAASYEIDLWGRLQTKQDAALLDVQASNDDLTAAPLLYQQQEVNRMGIAFIRLRFNAGR